MKQILARAILIAFVLCALFLLVAPISAQAAEPGLPTIDPATIASQFMVLGVALLLGFVNSLPTTVIVSFLKRFDAFKDIAAERLAWIVGILLFVILLIAVLLGYEVQFRSALSVVIGIIGVLVGPGATFLGSGVLYQVSKSFNVPVLGYQRSNPNDLNLINGQAVVVPQEHSVKYGKADNKP